MRKVEDMVVKVQGQIYFERSSIFRKFLNGRTIKEALTHLEQEIHEKIKIIICQMRMKQYYGVREHFR